MSALFVKAGDTFFTHSNSLLGRLIRWGETDQGEEPAWTNHMGIIVEDGWIGAPEKLLCPNYPDYDGQPDFRWEWTVLPQATVVEALGHVRKGPLKLNGVEVRVFRPIPEYSEEEKVRFVAEAERHVGQKYGWWKLFGFLLKKATRGVLDFSKIFWIHDRPICSYLAAYVNEAARPRDYRKPWFGFGMEPQCCDPDEAMDFCESCPEFWREVK